MPYRQLEGYTRALHRLVPELPEADCNGIRKRIQRLPVDPHRHLSKSNDPATNALDSTGVKVKVAGWAASRWSWPVRWLSTICWSTCRGGWGNRGMGSDH